MASTEIIKLKARKTEDVQLTAVMTIAGSDGSGGAGIEADLKTFTAHGVYGLTCITALTAQNTKGVISIENTPKEHVRNILKLNCEDFIYGYGEVVPLKVVKTGMLTKEVIEILPEFLPIFQKYNVKMVVDPVMISTSGASLFDEEGMNNCLETIIKNAYMLTPNYPEACTLYKLATKSEFDNILVRNVEDLQEFVVKLQQVLGCENILVKGGHIPFNKQYEIVDSDESILIDILYQSKTNSLTLFESEFIDSKNTHGTGCTLASSIASNIAKNIDLVDSITLSIDYIHRAIQFSSLGHGNGPLNHMVPVEVTTGKSFYHYLKSHPKVMANWQEYTTHKFIEKLATNQLPFNQFLYFLKQDYYYLVNYAEVHRLAAAKAPTEYQKQLQYKIIDEINLELESHKKKLSQEYNIDYNDIDLDIQLKPGKACLAYCDYLLKIAENEDFMGIKVAVAPCLHGYKEAGDFGLNIRSKFDTTDLGQLSKPEHSDVYDSWLSDYSSTWYNDAHKTGVDALQTLVDSNEISQSRLDYLITMFNDVSRLEIEFWNEVLAI